MLLIIAICATVICLSDGTYVPRFRISSDQSVCASKRNPAACLSAVRQKDTYIQPVDCLWEQSFCNRKLVQPELDEKNYFIPHPECGQLGERQCKSHSRYSCEWHPRPWLPPLTKIPTYAEMIPVRTSWIRHSRQSEALDSRKYTVPLYKFREYQQNGWPLTFPHGTYDFVVLAGIDQNRMRLLLVDTVSATGPGHSSLVTPSEYAKLQAGELFVKGAGEIALKQTPHTISAWSLRSGHFPTDVRFHKIFGDYWGLPDTQYVTIKARHAGPLDGQSVVFPSAPVYGLHNDYFYEFEYGGHDAFEPGNSYQQWVLEYLLVAIIILVSGTLVCVACICCGIFSISRLTQRKH